MLLAGRRCCFQVNRSLVLAKCVTGRGWAVPMGRRGGSFRGGGRVMPCTGEPLLTADGQTRPKALSSCNFIGGQ